MATTTHPSRRRAPPLRWSNGSVDARRGDRVAAYLRRLGRRDLAGAPADLDSLVALHRAHVERVAYDTLPNVLGRPVPADADSSVAAMLAGRGGYCFHLNGAFGWLLERWGYAVAHHRAGVQGARDPGPVGANGNHLALTVELEGRPWLVDVGLGSALHEPVPLATGFSQQGPFRYAVRPSDLVPCGWRFDHDPVADSFVGMDLDLAPVSLVEATTRHTELSSSPTSPFVRALAVQRRDAEGVDLLRWNWLLRIDGAGRHERVLGSPGELAQVYGDVFGLSLDGVGEAELAAVYAAQAAAYERRLAKAAEG